MFDKLPSDLKLEIFKWLAPKEKAKLSQTSKEWHALLNSDKIWQPEIESLFFKKKSMPKISTSYKAAYTACVNIIDKVVSNIHQQLEEPIEFDKAYTSYRNYVVAAENISARLLNNRPLYNRYGLGKVQDDELLHQYLKKYDVNQTYNYFGFTLLHLAIVGGSLPAVNYLLNYPTIDLSIKTNKLNNTAEELLDLLIRQDPRYNAFFDSVNSLKDLSAMKELFINKHHLEQNLFSNKRQKL